MNMSSSTTLAILKLHAATAAFHYPIPCIQPVRILGQTFWKWYFENWFCNRHLILQILQSTGKFAKTCKDCNFL